MAPWLRDGFGSVTPYLVVEDVDEFIDFLDEAFGIDVLARLDRPDGTVMHAEIELGDSRLLVAEPTEDLEPMPAAFVVYVPDCDSTFADALAAGATIVQEPMTVPHAGERQAAVADDSGNIWRIATVLEQIDLERAQAMIDAAAEPEEES